MLHDGHLPQLYNDDPQQTKLQFIEVLRSSHSNVTEHLMALGFVSDLQNGVCHKLTESQRQSCVDAALSLLSFVQEYHYLDRRNGQKDDKRVL